MSASQTTQVQDPAVNSNISTKSTTIFNQIAEKIISHQETIIGPIAVEQAERVPNLKVDWPKHQVTVSGDESRVIDELVGVYKELFGQSSVEVCKEAAGSLVSQLPAGGLPKTLV